MNFKVRAIIGTLLLLLVPGMFLTAWAAEPTDSTISDSLKSLNEIQTSDRPAPMGTHPPMADWGLRDRVLKLTAPTQFTGEVKGRLSAVAGDTLVIEQFRNRESNYIRVPVSEVTRCRVQDGTSGHFGTGVLVGAVVGCGISLLVVAVDDDSDDFVDLSGFVIGAGTVGGAALGGLIGAFARTDKWKSVPIGSLSLGVQPISDGKAGLSLSLRF